MKRRNFVKIGSLSLCAIPFVQPQLLSSQIVNSNLNIGIIGCGSRGNGIAKLLQNHKHINVVACCDILPFRLEEVVKISEAKGYKNYKTMLEDKRVEAVIIATPFGLHDEMAIDSIQAGKHIYCEKTLAKGMFEIQQVIDAHKNTNLVFQTGHQYNSSPLYQKVHDIIKSGDIGEITSFECQWNRNGSWRRPVPDSKLEKIINWRMYREHSGGLVAELCSHQIDFICRVLEEQPKRITGFGGIDHWKDGRETFDNVHLLFEYPNGVDASFTCTTTNSYYDYKIKILGSKATIILNLRDATIYLEKNEIKELGDVDGVSGATKSAWQKGKGTTIEVEKTDSTLEALEQFYDSVRYDKPVYADIRSGAITSKCVQMSLDALYNGKISHWKDYPELNF